jgi:hypothetical protein
MQKKKNTKKNYAISTNCLNDRKDFSAKNFTD